MNAAQIKYARERALNTYNEKAKALRERFKRPNLSMTFKVEALRKGEFKIVPNAGDGYGLESFIVWTKTDQPDPKAYAEELKKLDVAYRNLMDELMLGDNEVALELLKAFEAA